MKTTTLTPTNSVSAFAVAITSLFSTVAAQAAFTAVPSLSVGTAINPSAAPGFGLTGTVVASNQAIFLDPFDSAVSHTVRSLVVDRGLGLLDFYYQVQNNTTGASDPFLSIWEFAVPGFPNDLATFEATFLNDGLATVEALASYPFTPGSLAPTGTQDVTEANRDLGIQFENGGFVFGPNRFQGDADNIDQGETSNWLVIRTSSTIFSSVVGATLYASSAEGATFAPIPEPSTIGFGLGLLGICAGGRFRKSREMAK